MIVPLVLELDEELSDNEEFAGLKTIDINEGGGHRKVGYVALIKVFGKRNDIRYGNLKATRYEKKKFGSGVI